MIKYVCQRNKAHVYDYTNTYYCTICPPMEGILKETEVGNGIDPVTSPPTPPQPPPSLPDEVGLCVIMMDASESMTDPAFDGIPLTRLTLVANSAASGIFDLERMMKNPNAFVACFKFDHRVELMFVDTVANLIKRYEKIEIFADYLYNELFKMLKGTDINKALQQAHLYVTQFLNKQLEGFPVKAYTPMMQRIFKYNSVDAISVPNVRVLLYTDGMQYVSNGSKILNPNPFKQDPVPGLSHDVLIGAFFGPETDQGCKDLRSLVSNCPIHNIPQFFLFDNPAYVGDLKYLFRMASGASGFCPRCLENQLRR